MEKLEMTELWVKGGTLFTEPGVKSPRSQQEEVKYRLDLRPYLLWLGGFIVVCLLQNRVPLSSLGHPGTHYVDRAVCFVLF